MFAEIITHDTRRPMRARLDARRTCGPYRWRPSAPGKGRGFYSGRDALTMDRAGSTLDLRLEWANDHLRGTRLSHTTGYYDDPFGDGDTLQPIVARLPGGRGFLAGWTMGAGMCGALEPEIYADPEDAARAAHHAADRDAEANRDACQPEDEDA